MLKISCIGQEQSIETVVIGEFYSHEFKINKLNIPETGTYSIFIEYYQEIHTDRNMQSLLAMLLLLKTFNDDPRTKNAFIGVKFDYLPFERMDKVDAQFEETLKPFLGLIAPMVNVIDVTSVHNEDAMIAPTRNGFSASTAKKVYAGIFMEQSTQVNEVEHLAKNGAYLVAVDNGVKKRYKNLRFDIEFQKKRVEGKIVSQEISVGEEVVCSAPRGKTFVLIDDVCSMGTTFINIGKILKTHDPACKLILFVHFMESEALSIGLTKPLMDLFDEVHYEKII